MRKISLMVICLLSSNMQLLAHKSDGCGLYGGLSFGPSQLYGKRTDYAQDTTGRTTLYLYQNKNINDTSLEGAIYGGYEYQPEDTVLKVSLEGFLSYGPYESTVFRAISPISTNSNQVSTLKRGIGCGLTVRAGRQFNAYTPYLLVGFRNDRFSFQSISPAAEFLSKRDNITGIDYGAGVSTFLDKRKKFFTALELRFTQYKNHTFRLVDKAGDMIFNKTNMKSAALALRFGYKF